MRGAAAKTRNIRWGISMRRPAESMIVRAASCADAEDYAKQSDNAREPQDLCVLSQIMAAKHLCPQERSARYWLEDSARL
jgi:hypothetical protein